MQRKLQFLTLLKKVCLDAHFKKYAVKIFELLLKFLTIFFHFLM